MERFASTAERIAREPAKLAKIALLADYFRELADDDLAAAARFLAGRPFAARDPRTLALGGRTIVEAARRVYGFDDAALLQNYRATGDLGAAIGALVRPPSDAGGAREVFRRDRRGGGKERQQAPSRSAGANPARLREFAGRDVRRENRH